MREMFVLNKDDEIIGLLLSTHVINEYVDASDELETNGYVSYITDGGQVHFALMSEVVIGEPDVES